MTDHTRNILTLGRDGVCPVVIDDQHTILVRRDDGLDGVAGSGRVIARPPFLDYPQDGERVAFEVAETAEGRSLRYVCTLPEGE